MAAEIITITMKATEANRFRRQTERVFETPPKQHAVMNNTAHAVLPEYQSRTDVFFSCVVFAFFLPVQRHNYECITFKTRQQKVSSCV